jgi:FixJ family two-component response regulator
VAQRLLAEHVERTRVQALVDHLTPREHEVLKLVVLGKLNKQIAAELGASEKTIKVHRGRVMQKMQVFSVAELVRLTESVGILSESRKDWTKV